MGGNVTPVRHCRILVVAGYICATTLFAADRADAQVIPTKTVKIYNNSTDETIYPVIAGYVGSVDLWMQAQFKDYVKDVTKQTFCNTDPGVASCATQSGVPRLYRAYVNPGKGILPGQYVSITIPFYTQLTPTTAATIGAASGQFIDWWNAQRIFLYAGATALTAAYNYNVDQNGSIVPPTLVMPMSGAAIPSCASDNPFNCEPVELRSYIGVYPTGSIPFQLVEYTFGAAEGPPPGGLLPAGSPLSINLKTTNFNISAVDGIYLPVAMAGTIDASDPNYPTDSEYLGTVTPVPAFRTALQDFIQSGKAPSGSQWPYFFPSYFSKAQPTVPQPTPQDGDSPISSRRFPPPTPSSSSCSRTRPRRRRSCRQTPTARQTWGPRRRRWLPCGRHARRRQTTVRPAKTFATSINSLVPTIPRRVVSAQNCRRRRR